MHYDYLHAPIRRHAGLSGPAEDAVALVMGPYKNQANALEAYKQFVFGTTNIDKEKRHDRARSNDVTSEYKKVADASKVWVLGPQAAFFAVKDLKPDERERIYSWIWKKWEDAWKQAGLPNKQAISREDAIEQAKVRAKGAAEEKAVALRQRGAADANAGAYNPPPKASAGPDYELALYQAGWTSTGKPLPSGVAPASVVAVPTAPTAPARSGTAGGIPVVPIAIAVVALGIGAFLVMRKKG